MSDRWLIYRDKAGRWRWRRTAKNGEIVAASHQSYKNRRDAEANADRCGWRR